MYSDESEMPATRTKRLVMTSFTIAIEIICSIFGIPFPLWVVTAEFGYFVPPYLVQIIVTFVLWSSLALFLTTVPSVLVTVCPVSLPFCFAGVVIGGLLLSGLVFRGMARLAQRRLLRHNAWLRSAGD